ncbi:MAG: tetratricopeptide repeat protein, partial [Candidatus Hydrogenedentes bacterium]|nr:tetratricopeptide repeat protein [Candidatus Hydrogenedentota bacterium]
MQGRDLNKTPHTVFLAVLAVLVLATYLNTLRNEFVWDDVSSVQRNPYVQSLAHIPTLFVTDQHISGRGQGNFYRPLVATSFAVDYAIWGQNPLGYHITNILMHMAVVVCLYFVYLRMCGGGPNTKPVAATAAGIYAVLPVNTESVAYISGRADMMDAVFGLAAFLALHKARTGPRPAVWYTASILALVAAYLSKEFAVVFPILILIMDLAADISPRGKPRAIYHAASFALLAIYLVLRATVLNFAESVPTDSVPLLDRAGMFFQIIATYAGMLLWPVGLHMERSIGELNGLFVCAGVILVGAWIAGIVWNRRTGNRAVVLGLLWAAITIVPVSGLLPLNATIAEHWLYVPAMGITLAAVALGMRILPAGGPVFLKWAIFGVPLLLMAAISARQNTVWHDNETLFVHTLRYAPDSARVHYNLGVVYEGQGRLAEAAAQFEETLRLDPEDLYARLDLAGLASRAYRSSGSSLRVSSNWAA